VDHGPRLRRWCTAGWNRDPRAGARPWRPRHHGQPLSRKRATGMLGEAGVHPKGDWPCRSRGTRISSAHRREPRRRACEWLHADWQRRLRSDARRSAFTAASHGRLSARLPRFSLWSRSPTTWRRAWGECSSGSERARSHRSNARTARERRGVTGTADLIEQTVAHPRLLVETATPDREVAASIHERRRSPHEGPAPMSQPEETTGSDPHDGARR